METVALVHRRVHQYYWEYEWNCAVTTLRVLAEVFHVVLGDQVLAAAVGMHGPAATAHSAVWSRAG